MGIIKKALQSSQKFVSGLGAYGTSPAFEAARRGGGLRASLITGWAAYEGYGLYQGMVAPAVGEQYRIATASRRPPDYSSVINEQVFGYARTGGSQAPRLGTTGGQVLSAHYGRKANY